jgi:hypothetical protein
LIYKDTEILKRKFQPNPEKIMENLKNRESYLQRRAKQLLQWERVIDKLISRADKDSGKSKTKLRHHIVKIRVKKERIEVKLGQLREAENGKWEDIKADLEISWVELREAFLKASTKPK